MAAKTVNVGLVGQKFMGKAHSNAYMTVGKFFQVDPMPVMKAVCGRDEVDPSVPSFDQVYAQLNEERVNLRARRYLRDLRRDAVIDYR